MKHIYLIRHGETLANKKQIHQSPDEPLSVKGRKQAGHVALALRDKKIDMVISSPYTRARQTAEAISKEINIPFILDESFTEFRRPHKLDNKGHFTPLSLWYIWQMFLHREDAVWNDDGAENMFAIRNRVIDAKTVLQKTKEEHIAIVSHTIFMNIFLEMACKEKKLSLWEFGTTLLRAKKTRNGDVIHLYFDENVPKGICQWQLIEYIKP